MTKGLTDPRHYAAIAEVLRGNGAETEGQFKPGEMAQKLQSMADFRFGEGHNAGYDAGMDAGYAVIRQILDRSVTEFQDDQLTELGASAFAGCAGLTSVELPNLTKAGNDAFSSCTALTQLSLPVLSTIGTGLCYRASALKKVHLPQLPGVPSNAFFACTSMTSFDAENVCGIMQSAFANCNNLPAIKLPKCYMLYSQAFDSCTVLGKVDIGETVDADVFSKSAVIGTQAFAYCYNLRTLIIRTKHGVVPLRSINAFDATPIATGNGYIYVPASLVAQYKAATNWSAFAAKFRPIESYPSITGG